VWLREPAYLREGEAAHAERRAVLGLSPEIDDALRRTAHHLGTAIFASVVDVSVNAESTLTLVTVVSETGAAQVAVRAQGCGLRSIAWPLDEFGLAAELSAVLDMQGVDGITAIAVSQGSEPTVLRWTISGLTTSSGLADSEINPSDALRAAVAIAAARTFVPR
jgi:hypothetical protein